MKHKFRQILSALLSLIMMAGMLTGLIPQALALSGGDKVTLVFDSDKQNYFQEQKGGAWVSLPIHECYAMENGEKLQAYCMDHGRHGIHEIAPSTNRHTYVLDAGSGYKQNPKAVGVIMRGSGRLSLQSFLNQFTSVPRDLTEDEYRYATQTAMWASLGQLSVSGTPFTSGNAVRVSSQHTTQGNRILAATRALLNYASKIDHNYYVGMYLTHGRQYDVTGDLDWSPTNSEKKLNAAMETLNGKEYYTQEIKVASASFCQNYDLQVGLYEQLDGTLLQVIKDGSNNSPAAAQAYSKPISVKPISQTTNANANGAEYYAIVKVWVPKDAADAKGAYAFNIQTSANVEAFDIFVGRASGYESSTAYQKYLISGPQWKNIGNKLTIKWGNAEIPEDPDLPSNPDDPDDPDTPEPSSGSLTIRKVDADTGASLGDCTVQLEHITSGYKTTVTTLGDGIATFDLPADKTGGWKATEIVAPPGYGLDENPVQTFAWDGSNSPITLTFQNHQKPSIQFIKRDAVTGETLAGAVIEVSRNDQKIGDYTTEADGTFTLDELLEGTYTFREKQAPEGYLLSDEVVTQYVDPAQMATRNRVVPVEMKNYAELQLKIVKYDMQSKKKLPNVTFEIYRDTELIETAQTDANGEILLTGLLPGTYLVKEVATDDAHVVNSTPQQIELKAGQTGVQTLVFLNQLKPGIHLVKVDSETLKPLPNVKFKISQVGGTFEQEFTTDQNGEIDLSKLDPGAYQVREILTLEDYLMDDSIRTIQLNPDENAEFVFTNTKKPVLEVLKYDPDNDVYLPGATFRIAKIEDGSHYLDRVTDQNGRILIEDLEPGVYSVAEQAAPAHYVHNFLEYHVELFPGKTSTLVVNNYRRPNLQIVKTDAITGKPVAGATFTVNAVDSSTLTTVTTGADGTVTITDLLPGVYQVREQSVPDEYLIDDTPQLITLVPNETGVVQFQNYPKPTLTVNKIDSITGDPIKGAKFHVTYASNDTFTGEINDIGDYFSDENGQFKLEKLQDGWYKITEIEPAKGYAIKEPAVQEVYIKAGEHKVLTFENTPLSAIVIKKVDADTGKPLEGAWFRIRFLGGTSGTGGTIIGEYPTSSNGTIVVTGLDAGTYVVEEISAPDGYVINDSAKTVYLSGKEQDVITVVFGDDKMGSLLIVKKDAVTGEPLSDVEFLVTNSDGGVIGSANGKFVTDSAGTIRIDGLEPGMTVIAKETRAKADYVLDDTPQTIKIKANETMTLEFRNQPKGCLVIKKIDSVTHEPLSGVQFEVKGCNGCDYPAGLYTTDANGMIRLSHIPSGCYSIVELQAKDGYRLDDTVHTVKVENGVCKEVTFENEPLGGLLLKKMDAATKEPLADVVFKITRTDGTVVGTSNGEYRTDERGFVSIPDLAPGGYIVQEVQAKPGYLLDDTPKTIEIKDHQTYTLEFFNQPKGNLIIHKLDSNTKQPLQGVQFQITTADGTFVPDQDGKLSSNGLYFTDENGQIVLSGLAPDTYIVTEVQTIDGYTIDEATRSQTVVVNTDDTQELYFYNTPVSGLTIIKEDAETGKRLKNVEFEVRRLNGEIIGTYTTGANGSVVVPELDTGWYEVVELKSTKGYIADSTPHQVEIQKGENAQLIVTNRKASSVLLHKIDSVTKKGIYGVKFLVSDKNRNPIGEYETDQDGYIYIDKELEDGKYFIREIEAADGYILDDTVKTFYIEYGETSEITWENTAITGQIQVIKTSEDFNSVTNLPAGSPLPGAVFEIIHPRTENVVETIVSDVRGIAASSPLPVGWYKLREKTAPAFYYGDASKEYWVEIKCAGDVAKLTLTNKSLSLATSIRKTGNQSIIAGDAMRYDFSQIQNLSNVPLENFYWHEAVPYNYGRMSAITTGTFNQRLWYSIEYKTNLADYRTLATNLLTTNSYTFDVTANGLGLPVNEFVTDIRFNFGTVQPGFKETVMPTMTFRTFTNVTNNTRIVNRTDVGGRCGTEWDTATAEWMTVVIGRTGNPTLPKTGY